MSAAEGTGAAATVVIAADELARLQAIAATHARRAAAHCRGNQRWQKAHRELASQNSLNYYHAHKEDINARRRQRQADLKASAAAAAASAAAEAAAVAGPEAASPIPRGARSQGPHQTFPPG